MVEFSGYTEHSIRKLEDDALRFTRVALIDVVRLALSTQIEWSKFTQLNDSNISAVSEDWTMDDMVKILSLLTDDNVGGQDLTWVHQVVELAQAIAYTYGSHIEVNTSQFGFILDHMAHKHAIEDTSVIEELIAMFSSLAGYEAMGWMKSTEKEEVLDDDELESMEQVEVHLSDTVRNALQSIVLPDS